MKITFSANAIRHEYLRGMADALQAMGEDVSVCSTRISAFDSLDIEQPDIFVLTQQDTTKDVVMALSCHKDTRIILYSVVVPKGLSQNRNPDVVIVPPLFPSHIQKNIEHDNVVVAKHAANLTKYYGGFYNEKTKSDILVVVDAHNTLSTVTTEQINSVLDIQYPNLSVKCIGYRVNTPLYIGQTNPKTTLQFLKSTRLTICYSSEMLPNCVANRVFCLTPEEQDWVPYFNNEQGLIDGIAQFLTDEKQTRSIMKRASKQLLKSDTYFHRVVELGKALSIDQWQENALTTLPRFIA